MDPIARFLHEQGLDPELRPALEALISGQPGAGVSWAGPMSGFYPQEEGTLAFQTQAPTAERYQDLGPLGTGGMGEVRRALDTQLGRVVALKLIRPEHAADPKLRLRFLKEARATAQLTHPGIIPLYETGVAPDGRDFFTMALVEGDTLQTLFADESLSRQRKVLMLRSAAQALAFAHERGVLHRDFKPANVMVGRHGEVRVVDWGLVLMAGQRDGVSGTPAYMSPEQARGQALDARSELWSLGACLVHLLGGSAPWPGEPPERILERLREGEIPPVPAGPPELMELCWACLQPDPAQRLSDADAFIAALDGWLEDAQAQGRAMALLARAQGQKAELDALRAKAQEVYDRARQASAQVPPHAPEVDKHPVWALEDQAAALQTDAELAEFGYLQDLQAALAESPLPPVHEALADYYRERHAEAEALKDPRTLRFEILLSRHNRGAHDAYLAGTGWLNLESTVPVRVRAFRYVLRQRRLVLEEVGDLGSTPIVDHPLERGSYLLLLSAPGHVEVRQPVEIQRGERWVHEPPPGADHDGRTRIPKLGELDPREVFVPAGWFRSGDPLAKGGLERQRVWVHDFVIWRTAFTNAEYLAFLNDLLDQGREQDALRHVPRAMPRGGESEGAMQYGRDADGRFCLVPDEQGDVWLPEWPVLFVNSDDAQAACAWMSRQGRTYRLPWELEREKAVRGVDGRQFSWGDEAEATWSVNRQAVRERPVPVAVGSASVDESPYGVLDGCGNAREHCLDPWNAMHPRVVQGLAVPPLAEDGGWRNLRGGCWASGIRLCAAGNRFGIDHQHRSALNGFRPARLLE